MHSDAGDSALPPCPHRPPCPGCPRYGERGISPRAGAALRALAADAGLPPPRVVSGAAGGFRHRARLAVRGRAASPKVGLFQSGSHRIADVPRCPIHHPLVNRVAMAVRHAVRKTGTAPYADRPHRGDLRYVQAVVERRSQTAQVVVVGNADTPEPLATLLEALAEELGDALHSLWWNGQPERSNAILGAAWERVRGPEAVREEIGGRGVFFPPGAFGQSHLDLADELVALVAAAVPPDARVVELYSGVGAIGLGLLGRARSVVFNEVAPQGLRGLELGLAALCETERARARIAAGPADQNLEILEAADFVIADPPRRGLDTPVLEALASRPPRALAYVSCHLPTLLSQVPRLLEGGGLRLAALDAFALHPYTDHVETVARFVSGAASEPTSTQPAN